MISKQNKKYGYILALFFSFTFLILGVFAINFNLTKDITIEAYTIDDYTVDLWDNDGTDEVCILNYNGSSAVVTIPSTMEVDGNEYAVTKIEEDAFKDNLSITTLTIPSSIILANAYAFSGLLNLEKIYFNATNFEYGYDDGLFGSAGQNVANGVEVVFDNNIDYIPDYLFLCGDPEYEDNTFANIQKVTIGNNTTEIGTCAFDDCFNLKMVNSNKVGVFNIPDSVGTINQYAFNDSKYLRKVTFGTNLVYVDSNAFYGCDNLQNITFKPTENELIIANIAFRDCSNLSKIVVQGDNVTISERSFFYDSFNEEYYDFSNCVIYVPYELVNTYKNRENWSVFASIIQPLPTFPNTGVGVDIILPSAIILTLTVAIVFVVFGGKKKKIIVK